MEGEKCWKCQADLSQRAEGECCSNCLTEFVKLVMWKKIKMEKTTCQICGREIKSKSGVIAHHGYTRPEIGWQTDSCMGARELPYEKSRDVIPKAIQSIRSFIGLKEAEIKEVEKGEIAVPFFRGKVEPNHPQYKIRQREYIEKLNCDVRMAEREIERLKQRYGKWKKE